MGYPDHLDAIFNRTDRSQGNEVLFQLSQKNIKIRLLLQLPQRKRDASSNVIGNQKACVTSCATWGEQIYEKV